MKGKPPKHIDNRGKEPWNKGIKYLAVTGEKHPNWKGENVSYRNLHRWVERNLGKPRECWLCGSRYKLGKSYDWANISGKYRRDLLDWMRLCKSCHKRVDLMKASLETLNGQYEEVLKI